MRPVRADDYSEPLRGKIERGEIEPPDEFVIEDGDLVGSNYMQAYGAAAAERLRRLAFDERER